MPLCVIEGRRVCNEMDTFILRKDFFNSLNSSEIAFKMGSSEVVQYDYRNPYRRHSSIGIPVNHQFPESEYEDEFVPLESDTQRREYDVNRRKEGE